MDHFQIRHVFHVHARTAGEMLSLERRKNKTVVRISLKRLKGGEFRSSSTRRILTLFSLSTFSSTVRPFRAPEMHRKPARKQGAKHTCRGRRDTPGGF